MKRPYISENFGRLLIYIVKYRRLRGTASARMVLEQLILAYAKQLAAGMPEKLWRDNIITLINLCEEEHQRRYRAQRANYRKLKQRIEKANSPPPIQDVLRRTTKRKRFIPVTTPGEEEK